MTQWQVTVSDETDRSLREYLARGNGGSIDMSRFIEEAVQAELFRRLLRESQERNADLSPEEAQALANEAVAWARENRS